MGINSYSCTKEHFIYTCIWLHVFELINSSSVQCWLVCDCHYMFVSSSKISYLHVTRIQVVCLLHVNKILKDVRIYLQKACTYCIMKCVHAYIDTLLYVNASCLKKFTDTVVNYRCS